MGDAWAAAVIATVERTPTRLSDFLASLPGTWEMQIFYGLMLSGFGGMLAHYLLKLARKEITGNPVCYFIGNWRTALLSLLVFTGMAWTAAFNGMFMAEYGGFVGWKMVLSWGWSVGLSIDVFVNRTERERWDIEKRLSQKLRARGEIRGKGRDADDR